MIRVVHTADWHLGHRLGPFDRGPEHDAFLAWLLDALEEERAHALFVSGDVFDKGNPPPDALARFYSFLAEAKRRMPQLGVVVIGGNHDAAPRLDAPVPLLDAIGVTMIGAHDPARAIVPLTGDSGEIEALACAIPFLRAMDLVSGDTAADVFARVADEARDMLPAGGALLALGHAHLVGARTSDDSERALFSGALPASIVPDDVAYAALGHLHFAQNVGSPRVRYAGSPIPLSMAERNYEHSVSVVDVNGAHASVRTRAIPRVARFVRVPEESAPLDVVLDRLRTLDVGALASIEGADALDTGAFIEVRVLLDAPEPDLRARVEEALLAGPAKHARLVRVVAERAGAAGESTAPVTGALLDTSPETVLSHLYTQTYGGALPEHLRDAFRELLVEVEREAPAARGRA
jgi:exonuclease SbcD